MKRPSVLILSDDPEGLIYLPIFTYLCGLEDTASGGDAAGHIRVVGDIANFFDQARGFDYRFVDFGCVGGGWRYSRGFTDRGGIFNMAYFLRENPSLDIWFILTMDWEYYKDYDELWDFPNCHHLSAREFDSWQVGQLFQA
jgi:hypothetical protein